MAFLAPLGLELFTGLEGGGTLMSLLGGTSARGVVGNVLGGSLLGGGDNVGPPQPNGTNWVLVGGMGVGGLALLLLLRRPR